MEPVLVITNRGAGSAQQQTLDQALAVLRESTSAEVHHSGGPDELDTILDRADGHRLVMAGGDGSLHAVIAALHRRGELDRHVLGLLPLGTGNDFARSAGIPLAPADAARLVVQGRPQLVDLLVDDEGHVVVNNVHLGAGARASLRGARWKERLGRVRVGRLNLGRFGYVIGAVLASVEPHDLRVHIELDGRVVGRRRRPLLMVAIGNGASVGGGTAITPGAEVTDRDLNVMISHAFGRWQRWAFVGRVIRRGDHHHREDVRYVRGQRVTVSGRGYYYSADGELYGPVQQRSWRLEHGAYAMTLPD